MTDVADYTARAVAMYNADPKLWPATHMFKTMPQVVAELERAKAQHRALVHKGSTRRVDVRKKQQLLNKIHLLIAKKLLLIPDAPYHPVFVLGRLFLDGLRGLPNWRAKQTQALLQVWLFSKDLTA